MQQSHVIDVAGAFAGAAIRLPAAWRFVAVDPRVTALNAAEWPSLDTLRQAVEERLSHIEAPPHAAPAAG